MKNLLRFAHSRLNSGAGALGTLVVIGLLNNFLSGSLTVAQLTPNQQVLPGIFFYTIWRVISALLILLAILLWVLNDRRRLRLAVFGLNGMFTFQLLLATLLLVVRLLQSAHVTVPILIRDGLIIFAANILTFALWYWFIDSADTRFFRETTKPSWDFLFPQRQATLPGYENWTPRFVDYIFLAYMTSVAFSPTDSAPLSRAAKLLMVTQSAIALIVIAVIAGTAINMLAGGAPTGS